MAVFAYFTQDPAVDTVTAATAAEAAKLAAQKVAEAKPANEGTSSFPLWVVATDQIKAVNATYTVEKRANVTVAPMTGITPVP